MPKLARMLVLPGPPSSHPSGPLSELGEYAKPTRGAKLFQRVGAMVFGIPGSPGNTQPVGDPGNISECSPGTIVSNWPWASYQGSLASQRRPKFTVKFDRARQLSCAYSAKYFDRVCKGN